MSVGLCDKRKSAHSLSFFVSPIVFLPLYNSQADEESTERKSKSYCLSNGSGGYSVWVSKGETIWFDFLLLSFSLPLAYTHTHAYKEHFSLLNKNEIEHFNLLRQNVCQKSIILICKM